MARFIKRFLEQEAAGGILLMAAALIAFGLMNSPLQGFYQAFLQLPVVVKVGALAIDKPLLLWINDALMAIFFLMVGLEVKRELLQGSLAERDKALFPVIAALGGMVVPALIYLLFNGADPVARQGWPIPSATDIAFALGVMALLGKRVPTSLKVFLLALAIIDDLGAIVIIALFFTKQLALVPLSVALAAVLVLIWFNWRGVNKTSAYLLVGLVLWVAILKSGVHATLAGVILGFCIPLTVGKGSSPAQRWEEGIHPWVAYLILPLFAFANAGVSIQGVTFEGMTSLLPLGIIFGLVVGKPLGIFSFCWVAVKLGWAKLPSGIHFTHIFAVSVLCGIGFTMSIFISSLAFGEQDAQLIIYSQLGILTGSACAAVLGYLLLRRCLPVVKI